MAVPLARQTQAVTLTIDGREIEAVEGATIYEAASSAGIDIPVLCHDPRYDPVGVCRVCVVDIGQRVLAAACVRTVEDGMEVCTDSLRLETQRRTLVELLMADAPAPETDPKESTTADNELLALARRYGVDTEITLPPGHGRPHDSSSPVIDVHHGACILCDRCVRACDDIQGNDVIGRTGKGDGARIAFDLDDPMGESTCVSCGECVAACPTGALANKPITVPLRPRDQLKQVETVCPYCGVGCALTYHVDEDAGAIVFAEGRDQPGSQQRLCVKGRYGWDYAHSPQRLTAPLIRRAEHYPKGPLSTDVRGEGRGRRKPGGLVDYDEVMPAFREASWDEALELVASRLAAIKQEHGSEALAGFGSAKCSNEEAYLFQKLFRAGFGTNNVDHCTRLCHASSVAALMEGIGTGAVTTTYGDIVNADAAILAGTNTTANHPVASSFFKQARRRGTTLIVVDPRRERIADHADVYCQLKPGTDVAFYNAVLHEVIRRGHVDREYVRDFTNGFEEVARVVREYPPERAAQICDLPAERIREVAELWGTASAGVIYWGMGMSQHTTGTDNCRCLIALCAITGNVGRPGTGLHPLRGQNNVQGASDSGLIPMMYPDYQPVDDAATQAKFEHAWGVKLSPTPGLTVTEIMGSALTGQIRGMYMLGENPFLSDPNINKVRKALGSLEFLAVQDIFLTETAEFADVVLPASSYMEKTGTYTNTDRRVQVGGTVLEPPGQARLDLELIQDIACRIGLEMSYSSPEEVFDELVSLGTSMRGLRYDNLGPAGKLYPNPDPESEDGTAVLFGDGFPTSDGRAQLVAAEWLPAKELPDEEFPFVLNTGRLLEHWHTGSMTRRSYALDALQPEAHVWISPGDAAHLRVSDGDFVRVSSRRGEVEIQVRVSHRESMGNVFMPFHFREAAANVLTIDEIDPHGKIPEFKFCAVRIDPISQTTDSA
ncbi:MAG: formate dehydrogenase subunit alpha [Actinomycetia bacterium]|nr:formate dehydrogenase subunit alpha [Actinomycetes bacterium]